MSDNLFSVLRRNFSKDLTKTFLEQPGLPAPLRII